MQTDERPPPQNWYNKLVSTLKDAWSKAGEKVLAFGERDDPWEEMARRQEIRVLWEDIRRPFKEQMRDPGRGWREADEVVHRIKQRRRDLLKALSGDAAEDGQSRHPANE